MFAFHLGHRDVYDATQPGLLNWFAEYEIGSLLESFLGACPIVYNGQYESLLVRWGVPEDAESLCASGHIIAVDHKPIQMPAGDELDRTGRILAEMERGSVRP